MKDELTGERRFLFVDSLDDTSRRLRLAELRKGGLVIDTPGMRELQLWTEQETGDPPFDDVDALAPGCRFGDCRHRDEPGCAVTAAVAEGRLPAERLRAFQQLQDERAAVASQKSQRTRLVARKRSSWRGRG